MKLNYIAGAGGSVRLVGSPLGSGGEGQVLPVADSPFLVGKIFHQPTRERWWKLALMLAKPLPQTNGHLSVAWPVDLLFSREAQPKFAGYLMPWVKGAHPAFSYYNHQLRRAKHTAFDYHYLVRAARNLAAAVALAHQRGFVVGDANESNILVREDSLVVLIDVDSWQVADSARAITYRCPVGKGEFTAPELQGRNFADFDRLACHDDFALGVLLFKLLNEGSHPFDGLYRAAGDPPTLEDRIKSGAVPYRDRSGVWAPKPQSVPFGSLHPNLQYLFSQAFEVGHNHPELRPSAVAWQEAIGKAEADLRKCQCNSRHWFWGQQCVWCQRTALLGGQDPFPDVNGKTVATCPPVGQNIRQPAPGHQKAAKRWARRQSFPPPAPAPPASPAPNNLIVFLHSLDRQLARAFAQLAQRITALLTRIGQFLTQ